LICTEVVRGGIENLPILVSGDACDYVRPLKNPVSSQGLKRTIQDVAEVDEPPHITSLSVL
jgi:hypothetical protein